MPEDNQENPISPEDEEILNRLIEKRSASAEGASSVLAEALGAVEKPEDHPRKRYRLADLLMEMPEGPPLDGPEIREWVGMQPIGREFGASPLVKFARFSPDFMAEGRGDQEEAERHFDPTDEHGARTFAPMEQLLGLIKGNPEMPLATLAALCESQGVDLVLAPRDGSTTMAFRLSQGKLYSVLDTPSALDQTLKSQRIGVAKGKFEVPDPGNEVQDTTEKRKESGGSCGAAP